VSEERVRGIACDVTDEEAVRAAIAAAVDAFGGLNILITNAGGPPAGSIDDLTSEQWRTGVDLNLMSTIHLCRAALPHLRHAAKGPASLARILMITSISAKQPIPNLYLSNVARAGVQGFAKSLSEELGPEGITVNTILPGYTRTSRTMELARNAQAKSGKSMEEIEAEWANAAALRRMATPEEFAAAAVFLVSAKASYVTGVAFPVDGGRSKHLL
jgi:3-oxoacyl-[acyl-carrier protein] reductase